MAVDAQLLPLAHYPATCHIDASATGDPKMISRLLALGFAIQALGFGLREHAHVLNSRSIIDYVALQSVSHDPNAAPTCVYDCGHKFAAPIVFFGWSGIAFIVLGSALIIAAVRSKPT